MSHWILISPSPLSYMLRGIKYSSSRGALQGLLSRALSGALGLRASFMGRLELLNITRSPLAPSCSLLSEPLLLCPYMPSSQGPPW